MSIQIISSRRFLFQKTRYEVDPKDETGATRVAIVEAKVIVQSHQLPQEVPDWVKDDELFDIALEDGTIIEVSAKGKSKRQLPKGIDGAIKAEAAPTPVAKLVGEGATSATEDQTGWGATSATGLSS